MKIIACQSPANLKTNEVISAGAIVMDQKAYENIGRAMPGGSKPGAANIIVSPDWTGEIPAGWFVFQYLGDAMRLAISAGIEMMLVIGDENIRHIAISAYQAEMR